MSAAAELGAAAGCVEALRTFTEKGKALLDFAERQSKEGSLLDFIRLKIRIEQKQSLLGLIDAAAELYQTLHVKRIKDVEDVWRRNSHCAALGEALRDSEDLEMQWDVFLRRLDRELQLGARPSDAQTPSTNVSPDLALIDARSGRAVSLGEYLGKGKKVLLVLIRQFSCLLCRLHLQELQKNQSLLDAHSLQTVVVSFGRQDGASHWLRETGCSYDMLLDPHRQLYAAFGLGSSLWKVLNFRNMLLYAEYVARGLEFPRGLPSVRDDMFQLGGDFVLDERGTVLFSHCCQSPLDRPPLDSILSQITRSQTTEK